MKYKLEFFGERYPVKHNTILVECIHHKQNGVGISFCKRLPKGEQKLKGISTIGTCYKYFHMYNIPMVDVFKKDIIRWAVQHLQYENSNEISQLAKDIVKGNIDF